MGLPGVLITFVGNGYRIGAGNVMIMPAVIVVIGDIIMSAAGGIVIA